MYNHPGVYIEEIPSGVRPISAASTSIPIFLGFAKSGPINKAEFLLKWDDYADAYGGISDDTDAMGLAVSSFYANGGGAAYVARLASNTIPSALAANNMPGPTPGTANVLKIEAASDGAGGDSLRVQIKNSDGKTFDLEISRDVDGEATVLESFAGLGMNPHASNYAPSVVSNSSRFITAEVAVGISPVRGTLQNGTGTAVDFGDVSAGDELTLDIDWLGARTIKMPELPGGATYDQASFLANLVAEVKKLGGEQGYRGFEAAVSAGRLTLSSGTSDKFYSSVRVLPGSFADLLKLTAASAVTVRGDVNAVPRDMANPVALAGGSDGAAPGVADFRQFFADELVKLRDVSIMLLPGQDYNGGKAIIDAAIAHCERHKNMMVIVDPPNTELRTAQNVDALGLPTSTYSVLYYPWLKVVNPFHHPEKRPAEPTTLAIPPSAAMAGIWAKTDGRRGVWKAPAGINTALLGVVGTQFEIEDGIQGQLNPLGINCIRKLPRFNNVVWGSRTLATNADPEWRYVPIRRTAIMMERSIYEGIQWAVFEPNDHKLWASLRLNIETFMESLFRAGAFQGEKASDAFFVRCDLGDTMTQGDIDNGQVIVIVGFAPLKPAEFVIVRIQQKVAQQ
ncbi:MAG: phage tail sheath C-terminal domain-containing protein [Pseudomonadota bacterium]